MACGHPVARIAPAPPAPIIARTGCGTYEIGADGSVRPHSASSAPSWAPGAVSRPTPGVWVAHPEGQLAVYRSGRLLWRSHVHHGTDEVAVARNSIAFSVWGPRMPESFWIAPVGGREREISRGEHPIGWTANGLVTQRGSKILLRTQSGRVVRIVALSGNSPEYDVANRTVVFVDRSGDVVRTDGVYVWRLARGFRAGSWVQLIGNRILDITTGTRSVFLRADGARMGVTAPGVPGALADDVALPHDGGIVYVVRRDFGTNNPGINRVYLTRPHARPRPLYSRRIPLFSCGESVSLSYASGRILYVDSEGPIAILDPHGRERPVDFTRAFLHLQPMRVSMRLLSADWASSWR